MSTITKKSRNRALTLQHLYVQGQCDDAQREVLKGVRSNAGRGLKLEHPSTCGKLLKLQDPPLNFYPVNPDNYQSEDDWEHDNDIENMTTYF